MLDLYYLPVCHTLLLPCIDLNQIKGIGWTRAEQASLLKFVLRHITSVNFVTRSGCVDKDENRIHLNVN